MTSITLGLDEAKGMKNLLFQVLEPGRHLLTISDYLALQQIHSILAKKLTKYSGENGGKS